MKPIVTLKFPDVQCWIPTLHIAMHRASSLVRLMPTEYPSIDGAMEGTVKLFQDDAEVVTWMRHNMTWDDLQPVARIYRMNTVARDIQQVEAAATDLSPELVADLNSAASDLPRMPIGLLMTRLEQEGGPGTFANYSLAETGQLGAYIVVGEKDVVEAFNAVFMQMASQIKKFPDGKTDNTERRNRYQH